MHQVQTKFGSLSTTLENITHEMRDSSYSSKISQTTFTITAENESRLLGLDGPSCDQQIALNLIDNELKSSIQSKNLSDDADSATENKAFSLSQIEEIFTNSTKLNNENESQSIELKSNSKIQSYQMSSEASKTEKDECIPECPIQSTETAPVASIKKVSHTNLQKTSSKKSQLEDMEKQKTLCLFTYLNSRPEEFWNVDESSPSGTRGFVEYLKDLDLD